MEMEEVRDEVEVPGRRVMVVMVEKAVEQAAAVVGKDLSSCEPGIGR